jgi:uncharacterized protein (DUF849 family)
MLQACLNGSRDRREHPALPVSPAELAAAARGAIDAGADELHVHPRGEHERDTLEPGPVGATVAGIRASCPAVPLGLTTGIWAAGGDPDRRLELIAAWEVLPDYVSVNVGEPGLVELCELVTSRWMSIEAGAWSPEDATTLARSGARCMRVLVEPADARIGLEDMTVLSDGTTARDNAELVAAAL